jgi:hypothetical protein
MLTALGESLPQQRPVWSVDSRDRCREDINGIDFFVPGPPRLLVLLHVTFYEIAVHAETGYRWSCSFSDRSSLDTSTSGKMDSRRIKPTMQAACQQIIDNLAHTLRIPLRGGVNKLRGTTYRTIRAINHQSPFL